MIINMNNFGEILMSRPAGKEAYLLSKSYVFRDVDVQENIILDFKGVKVLAPSWFDEFISGIRSEYANTLEYVNTENPSVKASLHTVLEE
ncbi:MAG: STAS-like domain-containing protein [Spirochaetaceae bacterium]|jgi:hypothetical protein|nr:STAS-like domain-containing protein [Spirochaetaceae bacterium]